MKTFSRFRILELAKPALENRSVLILFVIFSISLMIYSIFGADLRDSLCAKEYILDNNSLYFLCAGLFILLAFSFFLFLTVIPLGTVTVIMAGFLLGPAAGFVQYIALIGASILLFELGRENDDEALVHQIDRHPRILKLVNAFRSNGIAFVIASRILPVVPSAVASLSASYFGIKRRDFIIGTVCAGWVRPVGFGFIGAMGRWVPLCQEAIVPI